MTPELTRNLPRPKLPQSMMMRLGMNLISVYFDDSMY